MRHAMKVTGNVLFFSSFVFYSHVVKRLNTRHVEFYSPRLLGDVRKLRLTDSTVSTLEVYNTKFIFDTQDTGPAFHSQCL